MQCTSYQLNILKKEKEKLGVDVKPDNLELNITKVRTMQCQNDIIEMLLAGIPSKEIYTQICAKYRHKKRTVGTYISTCRKIIRERKNFEVDTIVSLHIQRYEEIYARLHAIKSFTHAMNALKAKEVLLGMHKDGFHMRVNQGEINAVFLQNVSADYKELTGDRKLRFEALLNKARR